MTTADATKLGVDQHWRYLCVDDGKANMAPLAQRRWFKMESVLLGNGTDNYPEGDSVGVVTKWTPPDHLDGVTGADFDRCAAAIRAARWKENVQAKDWVGKPIARTLGLDLSSKADKAKTKALVDAWIAAGSLVVVQEKDEHRENKKYVRVADDA